MIIDKIFQNKEEQEKFEISIEKDYSHVEVIHIVNETDNFYSYEVN